jgi:signal transduction histidine kinase
MLITWCVVIGGVLLVVMVAGVAYRLGVRSAVASATALRDQERLLADLAHDLRTPVSALLALAEAALTNPDQRVELLSRTVKLSRRMGAVIDGVLMHARLTAGVIPLAKEPVWLDQLVSTVVEETPAGGAQVTVTAAPTRVAADPVLVRRAVGNLLDNALRHGRLEGRPATVQVTVTRGRVIVADQGPGIDPSLAAGMFDRFAGSGRSTGRGLSIVRWVVHAHGGTLRLLDSGGSGAIFEIGIPAMSATERVAAVQSR